MKQISRGQTILLKATMSFGKCLRLLKKVIPDFVDVSQVYAYVHMNRQYFSWDLVGAIYYTGRYLNQGFCLRQ